MTIRTLTLFVLPLGLLATACADSPTSPSSASSTERNSTTTAAAGTKAGVASGTTVTGSATAAGTTPTGTTTTAAGNSQVVLLDSSAGFALRFQPTNGGEMGHIKTAVDPPVPLDVANDFTIEFWIKAEPGVNAGGSCQAGEDGWRFGNVILDRALAGEPDNGEYGLSLSGGRIAFGVATTRGSQTVCGLIDVADNRWHHVAATRRSADGQLRIYVDGTESAQSSGPTGDTSYRDGRETPLSALDPLLLIGGPKQEDGTVPPGFAGWLDEMRVSNRVRYTAPFDRPPGPWISDGDTVVLYHFDEGPAGPCNSSVFDSSGHSTHGQCRQGAAGAATPAYVTDTPFSPRTPQRTLRPWLDENN